ncbi:hypothetical protein C8C89_1705 [Janthinobacterium sp. 75]|nr:hypothetical protein C8C89_1705 [Janthinobacterium sp. 75]
MVVVVVVVMVVVSAYARCANPTYPTYIAM